MKMEGGCGKGERGDRLEVGREVVAIAESGTDAGTWSGAGIIVWTWRGVHTGSIGADSRPITSLLIKPLN